MQYLILSTVNGGYTSWSEFSQCTVSCGGGTRQRWRLCTNPLPQYGGKNCSHFGPDNQIFRCNVLPCPGNWKSIFKQGVHAREENSQLP